MRRLIRCRAGATVLGALALFVGVIAGGRDASGDDRYLGAEHYEDYGPIEEQLNVNDPPVPVAPGRRLLREFVPEVAETLRNLPPFLSDTTLNFHIRSFYFNRELPIRPRPLTGRVDFTQEAWALGGWIGYQSGWLLDTFRMGAVGYTSQPAYAPDDRDGTGLLAPGQEGITVLGQAWGQLRYKDYAVLTGGRFLVDQGFVNPQDNRMIPNTFEGATLTGTIGPVEYGLGYLTAMKRRNLDTFDNMAEVAGATTGENRGLILTTVNVDAGAVASPLQGLQVFLGNYYVPDTFNTFFFNPEYRRPLNEDWRIGLGMQYWDQRSVGDQLTGDFETWQVGVRGTAGWRGLTFLAMFSQTGSDAGIRAPYGGWRGYISLAETDFNLANERAWEVGIHYDWSVPTFGSFTVPGLWTSLLYAESAGIRAQRQGDDVGKRREADLFVVWRIPKLPGFQLRNLNSFINQEGNDRWYYDFRLILDIDIALF